MSKIDLSKADIGDYFIRQDHVVVQFTGVVKEINGVKYYKMRVGDYTHSYKNQDLPNGYCSAPSLIETLAYLENNGVHIEIRMQHCKTKGDPYQIADDDEYQWKWYYAICKGDDIKNPILEEGDNGYVLMHPDMVSCLRAAIRKGVELL